MNKQIAEIKKSLAKVTWVIETHSDAAWPIFDRLEKELLKLESREDRLNKHRQKFG